MKQGNGQTNFKHRKSKQATTTTKKKIGGKSKEQHNGHTKQNVKENGFLKETTRWTINHKQCKNEDVLPKLRIGQARNKQEWHLRSRNEGKQSKQKKARPSRHYPGNAKPDK